MLDLCVSGEQSSWQAFPPMSPAHTPAYQQTYIPHEPYTHTSKLPRSAALLPHVKLCLNQGVLCQASFQSAVRHCSNYSTTQMLEHAGGLFRTQHDNQQSMTVSAVWCSC